MNPTRRQLLVAAGAATGGAALLAACSDDGEGSNSGSTVAANPGDTALISERTDSEQLSKNFAMVQRFPNHPLFLEGEEARLAVSILRDGDDATASGLRDNGPATINGWIEDFNKVKVADIVATRRYEGINIAYWSTRATLPKAVIHALRFDGDDGYGAVFEVFDPADVITPAIGSEMPPFDTPTDDDHRGVEPYCTLAPEPCPFHSITLREALALGKPLAYIIGTPAHCTTGTCSPGLQFLMAEAERVGDAMVCVHADVYTDDAATEIAPAVSVLGVQYEPIIYFVDANGVIVDRLDGIWDKSELRESVDNLLS
ncbi:MAG: hypothetical protein Q7V57_04130 [Actinomycetota bacterium]|nr:hypothetical protein [Actinomycetota bacterium]